MDDGVDKMITGDILPAKIPVQSKCHAGNRSVQAIVFTAVRIGKKGSQNRFMAQRSNMQPGIRSYIGSVIHMPGGIESVAVNKKNQHQQQYECNRVSLR
jgi:hypothetical protein